MRRKVRPQIPQISAEGPDDFSQSAEICGICGCFPLPARGVQTTKHPEESSRQLEWNKRKEKDTAEAVSFSEIAGAFRRPWSGEQLLRGLLFDVLHHVADRLKFLRIFIGNFDGKFFLESHDQLDGIQRIRTQIFNE
jgi:hypothetical protein